MSYERYIYRNGKRFGPYVYHSKKINGKVISEYEGKSNPNGEKKYKLFVFIAILIISSLFLFLTLNFNLTGKATLLLEEIYYSGEMLQGNMEIIISDKELIPANSGVTIFINNNTYNYKLNELVNEDAIFGDFYIEGEDILGSGEGYGISKEERVDFVLNIYKEEEEILENVTETIKKGTNETAEIANAENPVESNINETSQSEKNSIETGVTPTETQTKEKEKTEEEKIKIEKKEDKIDEKEEQKGIEEIPEETSFEAEKNEAPVESSIEDSTGESTTESSSESAPITGEAIKNIFRFVSKFYLTVTGKATYKVVEEVRGTVSSDNPFYYNLSEGQTAEINSSDERVKLKIKGNEVEVTMGDKTKEKKLLIDISKLNIPVSEGMLIVNLSYNGIEYLKAIKEIKLLNSTINITIGNETIENTTIETIQHQAVIGKPVKWTKKVDMAFSEKINISIPESAENINVREIENNQSIENRIISEEDTNAKTISTIFAIIDINPDKNLEESKTKQLIIDDERIINENLTKIEIEYETPAPISYEIGKGNGKEIVISSELHYENILAYTQLENESALEKIKLYYYENGVKIKSNFTGFDNNNNTLIDYIEWNIPHLSNQTYELVIEVTKAEHLNENRTFISDIYDYVKILDGNYTENINSGEYVRVVFERNLTNKNDITVFPKIINGTPRIEVYEKDKNEIVAKFDDIISERYNKVFLANLIEGYSQDTFDLKILNGILQFDYIIDPPTVSSSLIASTYGTNYSSEHLTSSYTMDGANIGVVSWYKNNISNPILHLPFDTNTTIRAGINQTVDYSSYSYNATLMNSTNIYWNETGGLGGSGAYRFNGQTGSYLNTSVKLTSLGNNFSVSLWLKTEGAAGNHNKFIIGSSTTQKFSLQDRSADPRYLYLNLTGATGGISLYLGNLLGNSNWHHLAIVYDSRLVHIYGDGQGLGSYPIYGAITANGNLQLAGDANAGSWNGTLDDVMVFNRSLSYNEILNLYNRDKNTTSAYGTNIGDSWKSCIIPVNDTTIGSQLCSNELTILSETPSITNIVLTSTSGENKDSDNLSVSTTSTNLNPNSKTKTVFNWYKNGQPLILMYLPFEKAGAISFPRDYSGNGFESDVFNGATFNASGGYDGNGSFNFNAGLGGNGGTNGLLPTAYINTTVRIKSLSNFSFYIWFKNQSTTVNNMPLIGSSVYTRFFVSVMGSYRTTNPGRMAVQFNLTGVNSGVEFETGKNITDGNWHQVAVNYNGTGLVVFLDGDKTLTKTVNGSFTDDTNIIIGRTSFSATGIGICWNGSMDEFVLFNQSLSDEQISSFYYNGLSKIVSQEISNGENWSICATPTTAYEEGQIACSPNVTIGVSGDSEYPIFSNYWDNNASANGTVGYFNVTLSSTNGTVVLQFNNTNYTASNNSATSSNVFNVSIPSLANGTYAYLWSSWGNGSSHKFNSSAVRYYSVNESIVDNEYPVFFDFQEIPPNGSEYSNSILHRFNVSINSTNSSSGIEFNGINYTISNLTYVYNFSINSLSAGVYTYYWFAWGNGSSHLYNVSDLRSYTILNATPSASLTINPGWTIDYGTPITVGFSKSNLGDDDVIYKIFRDNVDKSTGETVTLGAGTYNYVLNTTGGQNYSASSSLDSQTLTINQAGNSITPLLNGNNANLIITYLQQINASFAGTNQTPVTIKINGTEKNIAENYTLGAGFWLVNYSMPSNQNYSANETNLNITINPAESLVNLTINLSNFQDYGIKVNITCNVLIGEGEATLRIDNITKNSGETFDLSNGTHVLNCSYQSTQNYSSSENTSTFVINQGVPSLSISFSPSASVSSGTATTVTGHNCPSQLTCSLFRRNIEVLNPDISTLADGTYSYVYNTSGNENYSSASATGTLTVSSGGGGGGGGGGSSVSTIVLLDKFTVSTNIESVKVEQGGSAKFKFVLTNPTSSSLNFKLTSTLKEISLSENNFDIPAGESKMIDVVVNAEKDQKLDLLVGNVIVESGGVQKKIIVSIQVDSKGPLFDVLATLPKNELRIYPGGTLTPKIELTKLIERESEDVVINYIIKDEDGRVIANYTDTRAVLDSLVFTRTVDIPSDLNPGNYILYVQVEYVGKIASSSSWFSVVLKSKTMNFLDKIKNLLEGVNQNTYILAIISLIGVIILIFIAILIIFLIRFRKIKHYKKMGHKKNLPVKENKFVYHRIIQKHRHYKKIRKQTMAINELKKKINRWKKKGYYGTGRLNRELENKGFK